MKNESQRQPTVVVYSSEHETYACSIIRILAPLLAANWHVVWATKPDRPGSSFDVNIARQADLIIIQRQFPSVSTAKILRLIIGLKIPIVYDLDDMFLDVPISHPNYDDLNRRAPFIKWILKEADIVTVSTGQLQESFKKHTTRPILVKPNLVDWALFDTQPRPLNNQFNFLVSGTPTHQKDWSIIEEPLAEILNIYPKQVNAVFFGELPKRFFDHSSARFISFQRGYKHYASCLRELDIHAALVPLEDNTFNLCKSNIKWLEYSAAGIAGVFSDIAPYNSSIRNGENGILVNNSADSWFEAMQYLLTNPEAKSAMLEQARREIHEKYSVENLSGKYVEAFNELLGRKYSRSLFSELSMLPNRLQTRTYETLDTSTFLNRHIMWRFNRKH